MITRLPAWVWGIAGVLAFISGMINVIGLMGFDHQAVSHLTGSTSLLSAAVARRDPAGIVHVASVIGGFLLGTISSGLLIKDSALQLGRSYGIALLLEAGLLSAAMPLLLKSNSWGMCSAACACGLQSAMMSTYSGTVIRTTHVSGMFTDLGISAGHWLRGHPIDHRRLRLCVVVIAGFATGGVAGALLFNRFSFLALSVPIGITAGGALAYLAWRAAIKRPSA
jgi:uncharacterized membrane protein YoaK (UPF0700 family)